VSVEEKPEVACGICGKKDHKTYISPFSGRRKVSYLACDKFVGMTPLRRGKVLDDKGFCRQCLCSGVKKGHKGCKTDYTCKDPSHGSDSEGYHVLVCSQHKDTSENEELLEKFKQDFIQKFEEDLPPDIKNIKITRQSQVNFARMEKGGEKEEKGIFMLQKLEIEGESFNIFYDTGCGEMICKKSAIDKLARLGRASQIHPGPINISGVGNNKTVSKDGVYTVTLPMGEGQEAVMSGVCLNKVTGKFPVFSLGNAERDIRNHYESVGNDPDELPSLPDKVS